METNIKPLKVEVNLLDKAISFFNPKAGIKRIRARAAFNALGSTGYIVPGSSRRSMRGWGASPSSADQDTIPILPSARAGSRDLYMNSGIAHAALSRPLINSVHTGLRFQSSIDYDYLGLSKKEGENWERQTEREFRLWAMSKDCDLTRRLNFYELQKLAFLSTLMNGDCFALFPMVKRIGQTIDLRVHLIEADYCSNPGFAEDTEKRAGGIELDRYGVPYKYYFKKRGNSQISLEDFDSYTNDNWISLLAFGAKTGRRNLLHLYNIERINQRRGIPMLAPVFETIKQMSRLSDSELMAAVINSFFTVIIKSSSNNFSLSEGFTPEEKLTDQSKDREKNIYEMAHGNFIELDEDEDVEFADPKRPNSEFAPFYEAMCKQVGACINIPVEEILLQFNTSYSAARAALQQSWKFYGTMQVWLVDNFCQPIYDLWLFEAILKGRINAPGFLNDPLIRQAWMGAIWSGIKPSELDPLKETKAKVLKIQNHLSTHAKEFDQTDRSTWEESMYTLSRERKVLEDLKLLDEDESKLNVNKTGTSNVTEPDVDTIEEVIEEGTETP